MLTVEMLGWFKKKNKSYTYISLNTACFFPCFFKKRSRGPPWVSSGADVAEAKVSPPVCISCLLSVVSSDADVPDPVFLKQKILQGNFTCQNLNYKTLEVTGSRDAVGKGETAFCIRKEGGAGFQVGRQCLCLLLMGIFIHLFTHHHSTNVF